MPNVAAIAAFASTLTENVERVIVGKRNVIELMAVALLCDGHVLLEDVPGVGKTMLARAVAASIGGSFKRLQCTPDLLPNDVTGVEPTAHANEVFNVFRADESRPWFDANGALANAPRPSAHPLWWLL